MLRKIIFTGCVLQACSLAAADTSTAELGVYPGTVDAGVTGTVTVDATSTALTISGTIRGLPASTTGGFHIHSGFTCAATTVEVGLHWHAPAVADPWTTTTYTSDAYGVAVLSITKSSIVLGYDPLLSQTHTVVVHATDTTKIACGVLEAPSKCADGIKNGDEVLIDCGGSCIACPVGATCDDKKVNGNEVGIDCGGNCPACETCNDLIKNNGETDVDCGGTNCDACDKFHWRIGEWGPCDTACGGGLQDRTVECVDGKNIVQSTVAECESLVTLHESTSQRECNAEECRAYGWDYGDWEPCLASCGDSTQRRDVFCSSSDQIEVPDAQCGGNLYGEDYKTPKPDESVNCVVGEVDKGGTEDTPARAVCSASYWEASPWGACTGIKCDGSKKDATGSQTRTVTCKSAAGGVAADCAAALKPGERKACAESCVVYDWSPCEWTECTAACGGVGNLMTGLRSRQVLCMSNFDDVADVALCDFDTMPASSQVGCNAQACTENNWMSTAWSSCSNKGKRIRTIHCHLADGSNGVPEDCIAEYQPVLEKDCDRKVCDALLPENGFWKPPAFNTPEPTVEAAVSGGVYCVATVLVPLVTLVSTAVASLSL